MQPDRVPKFIAQLTLVAGAGLVFAPQLAAGLLGLGDDQHMAIRAVGLADLVLVPGLWRDAKPAPWMAGRCALSLGQGAYFDGVAAQSSRPGLVRATGRLLYSLSAADFATAIMLRRAREPRS